MEEQHYEVAIIDGDSIAWTIGYRHREEYIEGQVIDDVDSFLKSIINSVGAKYIAGYLGNRTKTSLRRDLAPTYKSNRGDTPDWYKRWVTIIEYHLIKRWNFKRAHDGYEADDMIAAAAAEFGINYNSFVIVGVDKDLKQIPGNHYNYVKGEFVTISPEQGNRLLALQTLTGDSTDGIKGLHKVGPKTAEKMLEGIPEDVSLYTVCLNEYIKAYGENIGIQEFYKTYMQVKLHADIEGFEFSSHQITSNNGVIPAGYTDVEPVVEKPTQEEDTDYDIDNLFKVAS